MLTMPTGERNRFERLVVGQSKRFGLSPEEYLRKVWYHEQAARVGEYVALVLLDQLLAVAPQSDAPEEEDTNNAQQTARV